MNDNIPMDGGAADLARELELIVGGWELQRDLTPWAQERLDFARQALDRYAKHIAEHDTVEA